MIKYFLFFLMISLIVINVILFYEPDPQNEIDQLYCRMKELEMDYEVLRDRLKYLELEDNKAKQHDETYLSKYVSEDFYV